jgi:hypothetical protein
MKPSNFNQAAYQQKIDRIVGVRNGEPLIKLAWAPDELRWTPHKLGDAPPGYTFPIFYAGKDEAGHYLGAERWVLLERIEWEQFGPVWEAGRYTTWQGFVWDLKGPCPSERYTELRCHSNHDGDCCPCIGDACECGEQYDHCWGKYLEPDEHLLNWIRKVSWEAARDPDVDPTKDIRFFETPHAQRELINNQQAVKAKEDADVSAFDKEAVDLFIRNPHTTAGLKKTEGGLYIPS